MTVGNKLCSLKSHEIDVLVVRQNEHVLCRRHTNCIDDILRAGIHSLTAVNHVISAKIAERAGNALTHTNRYEAVFVHRLYNHFLYLFLTGNKSGMLIAHILYLYADEHSVFANLFKHKTGMIGMYVYLYYILILNKYNAVTDTADVLTYRISLTLAVKRL